MLRTRPLSKQTHDQVEQHSLVIWIIFFLVHYYGFKDMAFTHHKLDHPVDKVQQVPVGTEGCMRAELVPNPHCTLIPLLVTA